MTHHHLNHPVEQSVLPDGDEALHLPGELEGSFARDHSLIVKQGRSGSAVDFNIFPGEMRMRMMVTGQVKFVLNPSFAGCPMYPNLLVAAQTVGCYTGVVPEVLVLDVRQSETVPPPRLLDCDPRPGAELSLLEEPGRAGLRLPGHQAHQQDGAPGAAGEALSLHCDDGAVCREEEVLLVIVPGYRISYTEPPARCWQSPAAPPRCPPCRGSCPCRPC